MLPHHKQDRELAVITGSLARPISASIERAIFLALNMSSGKVLYHDEQGQYQENHFSKGLSNAISQSRLIRGTRCFFNLELQQPTIIASLCPEPFDYRAVTRVNLYISPSGTGAPLHFDKNSVIIVQLNGNKVWQVSPTPALTSPTCNIVADEYDNRAFYQGQTLPLPERMHLVHLKRGDWLLVPKGYWHATCTHRGSISATLALSNTHPSLRAVPALDQDTIRPVIAPRLLSTPSVK